MPKYVGNTASFGGKPLRPEDALAEFLGMNEGQTPRIKPGALVGTDPSLELADLRGRRQSELQDRVINDPTDMRARGSLTDVTNDLATDPFTGDAMAAASDKAGADYNTLAHQVDPNSLESQYRKGQENFLLRKTEAAVKPPINPMANFLGMGGPNPSNDPEAPLTTGAPAGGPRQMADLLPTPPPGMPPKEAIAFVTKNLPPIVADLVNGLANYQYDLPKGTAMRQPEWELATAALTKADPTWVQSEYDNRKRVMDDYRSGAKSKQIVSLGRMTGHLADVDRAVGPLNNSTGFGSSGIGGHAINALENFFLSGNDPRLQAFSTPATAVGQEAGTLFHGQPSEEASRGFAGALDINATPASQREAIGGLAHLSATVRAELEDNLRRALRLPDGAPLPIDIMSPENAAIMDRLVAAQPSRGGGQVGDTVAMIAPDGRPLNVPMADVARMESYGARRR